ncbi:MAG: type IV conjugative transfer system protein TraL [Gammaproteobacteria bacterium]
MDQIPLYPSLLNSPEKVIFWTWNEIALFILVFFTVWSIWSFVLGLVLGYLSIGIMRFLENSPYGDLTKILPYWFSPFTQKTHVRVLPSHIREYLG